MNLHLARYVDRWLGPPLCFVLYVIARALGRRLPPLGATTPPAPGGPRRPHRVLGIKFYGLGNIVMILPTLRELRAAIPDVEIDFLTLGDNAFLLERSGLVRRVLTVDAKGAGRFLRSVLALVGSLRRARYDTVLDFEQFAKISGLFTHLTGAAECVGLNTEGQNRGWLYTTRVAYTDSDHTVDIFLRMIAPFGIHAGAAPPWQLPVTAEEREKARALVAAGGWTRGTPLVVMHVGNGASYNKLELKRWDVSRFAAVADALIERHGVAVAFTGQGPEERALIGGALAAMRQRAIDTCDRLTIGELTALVAEATFVLANDTLIVHLAGAVGTPVVALFGPTSPGSYGPRGPRDLVFYTHLYCSPCLSNYNLKLSRCTDNVCLKRVAPAEVIAGIEARYFTPARSAAGGTS
jgi:ADP-heptose:LPS heptosyltransferase